MKKTLWKFSFILILLALFTGCPGVTGEEENTQQEQQTSQEQETSKEETQKEPEKQKEPETKQESEKEKEPETQQEPENQTEPEPPVNQFSLTEKIAAATGSIDFENAEIEEDAVISKAILIQNLNIKGKKLTLEASGITLQNVTNAVIVVDKKVGEGDVTLTNCASITKLEICGGGSNSIHINNSKIATVEVKKENVRVALEEKSEIEVVKVESANTKIESEETIKINEISVSEVVDKITIKGGTVEKVQVVEAEDTTNEKTQIVIDGKTEVKSIEGTNDVQLTKEAIQNESNVVINTPVPVVTYYDSTLVFLSDGNTKGTDFENEDVYYEYVFDIEIQNEQIMSMNPKIKLYKLPDDIKLYIYMVYSDIGPSTTEMPDNDTTAEQKKYDTYSFSEMMYSAKLILKTAGLIKGTFSKDITTLETPEYDYEFDIKNCGIPEKIILPDTPFKPDFTVTPSSNGNVITFTFNDCDDTQDPDKYVSKRIYVYQGVKENDKWIGNRNNLIFEMSDNTAKTISFTDSFVTPGKEYAYCYEVDQNSTLYNDEFVTVTATGGEGEIVLSAENSSTDNGIKLSVSDFSYSTDYTQFYSIQRYYENDDDEKPSYVTIDNYITDSGKLPIVDYYTESGTSYIYIANYKYENFKTKTTYKPIIEPCPITATVGFGEPKITNKPAGSVSNDVFSFTTIPQIALEELQGNATYQINFNYVYNVDIAVILYDPNSSDNMTTSNKISNWANSGSGTYKYSFYTVSIDYMNGNQNSQGISYGYHYFKDHEFPGMENITK